MNRLILLAVLAASHSAFCGSREAASQAFPSVAMVVTEDAWGQPLAIGSGFFVKKNVLASNAHVIEGAAGGYIKLVGQKTKYELMEIVAVDTKHDLVLLAADKVRRGLKELLPMGLSAPSEKSKVTNCSSTPRLSRRAVVVAQFSTRKVRSSE